MSQIELVVIFRSEIVLLDLSPSVALNEPVTLAKEKSEAATYISVATSLSDAWQIWFFLQESSGISEKFLRFVTASGILLLKRAYLCYWSLISPIH